MISARPTFSVRLHLKMYSIFGQICRLQDGNNILAKHAYHVLTSTPPGFKSYFWKIVDICRTYQLKHPLEYFIEIPTKKTCKTSIKTAVKSYWHNKFLFECTNYTSIPYLKFEYLTFGKCHPI